ncbi:MAG: acetylxylan esterase [Cyanobacteria bacterium RYN_339]|nr:acetylxylan esterase [Cyanobacteria bacterium RYN_339]
MTLGLLSCGYRLLSKVVNVNATPKLVRKVIATSCVLALAGPAGAASENHDEARVGQVVLPDVLQLTSGKRVANADEWRRLRRPEILRLFETNVYGRSPSAPLQASYRQLSLDRKALHGLATRKELAISLTGRPGGPEMHLLVYLPNHRKGRAPLFLGLNFHGNQSINLDPGIRVSTAWMGWSGSKHRATAESRGREARRWPLETILARGYGVATAYYGDMFPDRADGLRDSIIPVMGAARAPDQWGAIAAWAWGLSRAMDYLVKDPDVEPGKIAVWGHSRLGKTALWAGALDERFAMVISNDSGEGGAAIARRNFGETVADLNREFPHWFAGNYKAFDGKPDALPVDQHMLIALMAPRPVYVASASEDLHADPRGEFLAVREASPVYALFGKKTLAGAQMPKANHPLVADLGYHMRSGPHDTTAYDWAQYLSFVDAKFGISAGRRGR